MSVTIVVMVKVKYCGSLNGCPDTILQVPRVAAGSQSQARTMQFPKLLQWAMRGRKVQAGSHMVDERSRRGSQSYTRRDSAIWARHETMLLVS